MKYLAATSVFFVALVTRFAASSGMSDDGYIVLRVARNIATGQGLSFNPWSHLQSSTSPAWTVISAAAWTGVAAGGIVLLACVVLTPREAALAGLLYATLSTTVLVASIGLETGLYVLVIVGAFLALAHERRAVAAMLAALAYVVRPDGALLAGAFLGYRSMRERRLALRELAIMTAIVRPYVVFALAYYGTLIPHTVPQNR